MSEGTSSNSIGALKRTFVFGPKIDFLPRGKPMALGQK